VTLAVTVVCQDGVVVAADSRTTLSMHGMVRVGSDFTHKVFEAGRVAIATFGDAFVLDRSVASHMDEFAAVERGNCDHPGPTAERLADFMAERCDRHWADDPGTLGFLVGGYDGDGIGEAWQVRLPDRAVWRVHSTTEGGGASWRGQSDVVRRIMEGFDPELMEQLAALSGRDAEYDTVVPLLEACAYRIPYETMNLQDGIDLAVFCIRTTVDVQRLTLGTIAAGPAFSWPGVGGPIEIATVTHAGGFAWVQRTGVRGERPAGLAEGQL
jgi:hypothetical protein